MINDFKIAENFNLREFACKCCGAVKIDRDLVERLQILRDRVKRPIIITSGYRCPKHNREVHGDENSYHIQGLAVDIVVRDYGLEELENLARAIGFRGIGVYKACGFIHLDLGPERRWTI
ncbi:MAG: D-Ala-D-Ala carboxypeptidase family metallohydrolase [bacterium]|nr:D-Ala-D-Ala carboxypeptidase family metallohydrolase [bacterium]